jgi:hypothetical protein
VKLLKAGRSEPHEKKVHGRENAAFFYGLTVTLAPVPPAAVPEPSVLALLSLAGLALIPLVRRGRATSVNIC